jgi:hypothetical protein
MGRLLKSISIRRPANLHTKICLKKKDKKLKICYLFWKKVMLARALIGNWQYFVMGYHEHNSFHQCQEDIKSLYHFERIPGNIPGAYVSLVNEVIRYIKYHVNPETDKLRIKISVDGSKVSRISNFVVLSFSVITDDLTLSSKDQNVLLHCKLQRRLWSFKTCLQTHFSENKHIIRKSKYWSWGETFWFRYFDGWW